MAAPRKRRTSAQINAENKKKLTEKETSINEQAAAINAQAIAVTEAARAVEATQAKLVEMMQSFEVRMTQASRIRRDIDVDGSTIAQAPNLRPGEFGAPPPIERMTNNDLLNHMDVIQLAAFMSEMVLVCVHDDNTDNAVTIPLPSVNGKNQGFFRGQDLWVKRYVVEALAHATTTRYVQLPNAMEPDKREMKPVTAPVFPFSVRRDNNPLGEKWLRNLLAQPT